MLLEPVDWEQIAPFSDSSCRLTMQERTCRSMSVNPCIRKGLNENSICMPVDVQTRPEELLLSAMQKLLQYDVVERGCQ